MIRQTKAYDPIAPVLVVDVGNTHTKIAMWHEKQLVRTTLAMPTHDPEAFDEALQAHIKACAPRSPAALIAASVVAKANAAIEKLTEKSIGKPPLMVGSTLPFQIDLAVDDPKAIGVDRVCAAIAAFDALNTACTVVDFGSAVTVDLVSDDGVFLGGAILPGFSMQMRALHEFTAALPSVEVAVPASIYGRNTTEAIQNGVCRGLVGAVRNLVEGYATHLKRWPQVVATGGHLPMIAPYCDFLDSLVPDLTLRGVGLCYTKYFEASGAGE